MTRKSWGEAADEKRQLRDYVRRTFPDPCDRLGFLSQYSALSCQMIDAMFSAPQRAANVDSLIAKHTKRKRGEKTKLAGGRLLEEIAVNLVRQRARQLKSIGICARDAWDAARTEVAAPIGIKPSTLENWQRGVLRRERARPLDQRSYARRKRFQKPD